MAIRKKTCFLVLFILMRVFAQAQQLTLTLAMPNPMPGQVSMWERDFTLIQATVQNPTNTTYERVRFSFTIVNTATGAEVARSNDNDADIQRLTVPPGATVFYGPDLVNGDAVTVDAGLRTTVVTTNSLPEGDFELCAKLLAEDNTILTPVEPCEEFSVILPDPPTLLTPEDRATLDRDLLPTFSWTPVFIDAGQQAQYRLVIAPIFFGQSTRDAIERNELLLLQNVVTNSYAYQPSDLPLSFFEDAEGFAWQVQALNNDYEPVTRNDGKSEISSFTIEAGANRLSLSAAPSQMEFNPDASTHHIRTRLSGRVADPQNLIQLDEITFTLLRGLTPVGEPISNVDVAGLPVGDWSPEIENGFDYALSADVQRNLLGEDAEGSFTLLLRARGHIPVTGEAVEAVADISVRISGNRPLTPSLRAVASTNLGLPVHLSHARGYSECAVFFEVTNTGRGAVELTGVTQRDLSPEAAGVSRITTEFAEGIRIPEGERRSTYTTLIAQSNQSTMHMVYELYGVDEAGNRVTVMAEPEVDVIIRSGAGTFSVTASSASEYPLIFHPGHREYPLTFTFAASESSGIIIDHYTVAWHYPDGTTETFERPMPEGQRLLDYSTRREWAVDLAIDEEGQAELLDRFPGNEAQFTIDYSFTGTDEVGFVRTASLSRAIPVTIRREADHPVDILVSSPDVFPLDYTPELEYHPVNFSFRMNNAVGATVTRYVTTWFLPDGSTKSSEDEMDDIAIPRDGASQWNTGLRVRASSQEEILETLHANRAPVRARYVFEIHDDQGAIHFATALSEQGSDLQILIRRTSDDTTRPELIVWAIPSDISFFPGTTSYDITYNLDLYPNAAADDTLLTYAVTYLDADGMTYREPEILPLPHPIILAIGEQATATAALRVDDQEREEILGGNRTSRVLTATVGFFGRNTIGSPVSARSNPITMRVFRTAEGAGLSEYMVMDGVAFLRPTQQTTITTQGDRRILNGTAMLVILPEPFDTMEVPVELLNLTFSPGSGLHVTAGSLMAESAPDASLFGLLGGIVNVTRLSYDYSRDSSRRLLIDAAYVMLLRSRFDLSDIVVNRDGISLRNASVEFPLLNFLTLRMTDMDYGKENSKKVLSFSVHGRLKGKPRNEEFGFTSLKIIEDGGLRFHLTPEPAPLRIISGTDYARFKDFEIHKDGEEWYLRISSDFAYPPPFAGLGKIETSFEVNQDGDILGEIAPIKENTPGFANDRSIVTIGEFAVVDLTYLGLRLSVVDGEIDKAHSTIGLACDFYFAIVGEDSLRVAVGDANNPEVTIDFDGNVHWNAITIAHNKKLKFGPVYVKVANMTVNPAPDSSKPYYFELSGGMGVDFPKVDGEVDFERIRIKENGKFDLSNTVIRGGEFSVVDVVHLGLDSLGFSDDPGTISFSEKIGDHTEHRSIEVDSYFKLKGASLSVGSSGDGGSGGFDELLVYTKDHQTSFLLRRAKIEIAGVKFTIDCKYLADDPQLGTILSVAGSAKTPKFEGAVVGKIGKTAEGKETYGLFLSASDLGIQIGPITLDQLGGGFFYNPIDEDLEIIRSVCGINRPEIRDSISSHRPEGAGDPGSFAAMIYAGAFVGSKEAVEGRALMTITENSLALDMEVDVLKKTGHGAAYLVFGWDPSYAEGRITFDMDYHNVVSASVDVDFYAYTSDVWGVNGTSAVKILVFAEADADFFIGPPGFMLTTRLEVGFDVGVLKASTGFETMAWWQKDVSWGAYANVWAEGEILWGLAAVSGRMEGALIGDPGALYCVGTFRAEVCWVEVFNGSVWVAVGTDGIDGGLGRNARYDQLIADAKNMAGQMEEEMNALNSAIEEAQHALASMSDEQVARAGEALMTNLTSNSLATALYYLAYKSDHDDYEGSDIESTIITDVLFGNTPRNGRWWLDTLQRGRDRLAATEESIQQAFAAIEAKKERIQRKLSEYEHVLTGELPVVQDLQYAKPGGAPTYATVLVNGAPRIVRSGFDLDTARAIRNKANAETTRGAVTAYENRLFELIHSLRSDIDTIDNILNGGTEPVKDLARDFADTFESLNDYYEDTFEYLVSTQNMAAQRRATLNANAAALRGAILAQTKAVGPNDRALWRVKQLANLRKGTIQSMDDSYNPPVPDETLAGWKEFCDSTGLLVWQRIPDAGFAYLINSSIAARDTARGVFARTRDGFTSSWNEYTETLDGAFERTSRLYEILYDVYDQLALTATRIPPAKNVAKVKVNQTPRQYFASARDGIATYLEIPRITGLSGSARSTTDHTSKFTASFTATHPKGISEYAYYLGRPNLRAGGGGMVVGMTQPQFRSLGSDTQTHLLLVQDYQTGEPDGPGNYEMFLRARTRSGYAITRKGTTDVEYSAGSIVDNSINTSDESRPTTPIVHDAGQYTSATGTLSANWSSTDAQSGIQEYQYSVESRTMSIGGGLVGNGGRVMIPEVIRDWTTAGGQTELTIRDLPLRQAKTYWVKVKSKNGVGLWSDAGSSDGITVDTTVPSAPAIQSFERAQVQNALSLRWSRSVDGESGIARYECAVGREPMGNDVVDWRALDSAAILTNIAAVSMYDGDTLFASLKAFNGSGLESHDTAITVIGFQDTTPPSRPSISEAYYRAKDATLHATWSAADPQSGIAECFYQYSLGRNAGGSILYSQWTSVGTDRSFTAQLAKKPESVRIKVVNGVRLSSTAYQVTEQR